MLGRYERAVAIDRTLLGARPTRRPGRGADSCGRSCAARRTSKRRAAAASALEAQPEADGLSHRLARTAREARGRDATEARASVIGLPFLYRPEAGWLLVGVVPPLPRPPRQ